MTDTTDPTLDDLLAEWHDLTARRADIDARLDQIKTALAQLGEGTHTRGANRITIYRTRRFDQTAAWTILEGQPPEVITACTETVISSTKAKKILPPALYEACQAAAGKPTVRVSLA